MIEFTDQLTVTAPDNAMGYRMPSLQTPGGWLFEPAQISSALEEGADVIRTYDDPSGQLLPDIPGCAPLGQLAALEADVERLFELVRPRSIWSRPI